MGGESRNPIEEFDGRGETFDDALEDAARKVIDENVANDGKEYVVLHHIVTVSNPRISEHKIKLGGSG
ncbi:MAG TPA: hypothetical protein VFM41_09100 [Gaiella sp.]|jgi:hypothetical protein|nr:hypothetical protein [Gaiella sp.]